MAQTDELRVRAVRDVYTPSSVSSYFDGRKLLIDDANYVLYDVKGQSTGDLNVGVVLRLAYKNPSTHQRIYIGEYDGKKYTMTCDCTTVSRVNYTITATDI